MIGRSLWPANQPVGNPDELLHMLAGQSICLRIRTLYVIGAFQFEEKPLLFSLFPNLQAVYLFEPIPDLYTSLAGRFQNDPRIRVFPYAISDSDGIADFHLTSNLMSSSLLNLDAHLEFFPDIEKVQTIKVQTRTLMSVIQQNSLQSPDMLFLDAQGAEVSIFSSLNTAIRLRTQIIYAEASTLEMYEGSGTLPDLESILDREFSCWGYAPTRNEIPEHGNALFINRFDEGFLHASLDPDVPAARKSRDVILEEATRLIEENEIEAAETLLDSALNVHIGDRELVSLAVHCKEFIYESRINQSEIMDSGYIPRNYAVTAIVSTYASEEFMEECLQDLEAQSIADNLEIIVLDAASPENEYRIVNEFQQRNSNIRYIRTPERIGIYLAWNLLIYMARGAFIIPFSTNDRLSPDACETLSRALSNTEVSMVYGDSLLTSTPHQNFYSNTATGRYKWPEFSFDMLLRECLVGPNPMWKKSVHQEIGYFDQSFEAIGDQDFWCRMGLKHSIRHIEQYTGLHWITPDSLSGDADVSRTEQLRIRRKFSRFLYGKP